MLPIVSLFKSVESPVQAVGLSGMNNDIGGFEIGKPAGQLPRSVVQSIGLQVALSVGRSVDRSATGRRTFGRSVCPSVGRSVRQSAGRWVCRRSVRQAIGRSVIGRSGSSHGFTAGIFHNLQLHYYACWEEIAATCLLSYGEGWWGIAERGRDRG